MSTNGMATAVALAGGIGDLGGDGGEQSGLFEADAPLPVAPVARGKSGPQGGRPAGARNKSTEEMRQYFLQRYRSPLIGLAEVYTRTADMLARELHLTRVVAKLAPGQEAIETYRDPDGVVTGHLVWDRGAAFDKQMSAMVAALPYVERKQPIAIDTTGKVAGMIVIGDMAGLSDGGDGVLTLDITPQRNQQVSDDTSVRLSDDKSDDEPKPMKSMGEFKDDA